MAKRVKEAANWVTLMLLILAGEAIFLLPFVIPRIFRPTVMQVFSINNTELGQCFSIYGVVAMFAYLLGGPLADRFEVTKMMMVGLLATALGGLYLCTYPPLLGLYILYGYWGCTTILLFWAALIKATRTWGSEGGQIRAFSFLDAGRGATAATFGLLGVVLLGLLNTGDLDHMDIATKRALFRKILLTFTVLITVIAALLPFAKLSKTGHHTRTALSLSKFGEVLKLRSVYLLAIIILAGYSGYKVQDIFSLFAKEALGYKEVQAAGLSTILLYMRPIIGLLIGLTIPTRQPNKYICIAFALTGLGSLWLAIGLPASSHAVVLLSLVLSSIGIYAVRCLYFAGLEGAHIPLAYTGTAVGVISVLGYTPDIFMGPMIGVLLDTHPGDLGFQFVFGVLTVLSFLGLLSTVLLSSHINKTGAR